MRGRAGSHTIHGRHRSPSVALMLAVLAAAPLALLAAAPLAAQAPAERLRELEARLDAARDAAVHLLAPRAFGIAADRLEDARGAVRGGDDDAPRDLSDAEDALDAAAAAADGSRTRFRDVLAARERALSEEAATRATEPWEAAEEELARAGRDAERGRTGDLAERVARATELYRRATRAARTGRLIGPADQARQAALSVGASELAPTSFAAGERSLGAARAALEADRDDEAVETPARAAVRAFERAAWIAALADSVSRRQVPVERLIEAHERDLERLLEVAGMGASPPTDTGAATDTLAGLIDSLRRENQRLAGQLEDERATSGQLADRVRDLEAELSASETRFEETRDRLLEGQRREARLRETRALFAPEEGDVLLTGDRLVLRLHGLAFASGSADISEEDAPLLTKVQRVLVEFPDAAIRIEGHTDSRGSAEANRVLSQRRAIAIREHLLARLPISSSRIEAVGLGEDRPIASNDDEEGRRRNRRIEIILALTDDGG